MLLKSERYGKVMTPKAIPVETGKAKRQKALSRRHLPLSPRLRALHALLALHGPCTVWELHARLDWAERALRSSLSELASRGWAVYDRPSAAVCGTYTALTAEEREQNLKS